jgi:hypothetical protein
MINAQKWIIPERPRFVPYHDYRFGIGYKPFEAAVALENFRNWAMTDDKLIDFDTKNYYAGARYTTNALFAEYMYQANKCVGIGATITYFAYFNNYYDVTTDAIIGYNLTQHVSLYPTLRFSWINNPNFSMYSSFGLGSRLVYESSRTNTNNSGLFRANIAGQITLFGFTFGKNIYCFTDFCTLGTQGMLTGGIGYRIVSHRK